MDKRCNKCSVLFSCGPKEIDCRCGGTLVDETDPNADLIGMKVRDDAGHICRVLHTATWNDGYVVIECHGSESVRVAAQVRQAKLLGYRVE